MSDSPTHLHWHAATVTRAMREAQNGHAARVLWFTGLSGAGKSTLAHAVEAQLHADGRRSYVFDGDNVRHGLCADLGFAPADRAENVRRIAQMCRLFVDAGVIALAAFISPTHADRERARQIVGADDFLEIHVDCPLSVCEARDVKGIYRRARAGEVGQFTGISAPYETPQAPALRLATDRQSLDECVAAVLAVLAAG
jgi:adenylylsulfate kinase